jgi:hypothetical protein
MLSKDIAEQFEMVGTDIPPVVQHPTFGRIEFANLDEKSASWLVEHGFFGLARKKAKPVLPVIPVIPPVIPPPKPV